MFGIDDAVTAVSNVVGKIIDRAIPDPTQAAAAKLAIAQMQQSGELAYLTASADLAKGQLAVNQTEAASANWFVSDWRPFIGWTCGCGLSVQFVISPLVQGISAQIGHPVTIPSLDMGTLLTLLFGMLGLGGMRTAEKISGVAK